MSMTFAALIALCVLLLLAGLLIAAVTMLLSSPKTRAAGLGVLSALGVVVLLGFFWVSVRSTQTVRHVPRQEIVMRSLSQLAEAEIPPHVQIPLQTSEEAQTPPPAWVGQEPKMVDSVYRMTVVSDPYLTKQEAELAINEQLLAATKRYTERLGEKSFERLPVDLDYIRHTICKEQFFEVVETSVGPMRRLHMLLEFDEATSSDLKDRLHAQLVQQRLVQAGYGAAVVLALVGTVFGYLTLDTATKGYYTRRLQLGAVGVILALVVAVVFVA